MSWLHACRRGLPLLCWLVLAVPAAAQSPPRWNLPAGKYFGYRVQVTTDDDEYTYTETGYLLYEVRSAENDRFDVVYLGKVDSRRTSKKDAGPSQPVELNQRSGIPFRIDVRGNVDVDPFWSLLPIGESLENYQTVVFQPLPEGNENAWQTKEECHIQRQSPGGVTGIFGGRAATDSSDYQMERTDGDVLWITKKRRIATSPSRTTVKNSRFPQGITYEDRFEVTGNGRIAFDRRQGLVTSISMSYTALDVGIETKTTTTTIECQLADPAQLQQMLDASKEFRDHLASSKQAAKSEPPAEAQTPAQPRTPVKATPAQRRQVLQALRSRNPAQVEMALMHASAMARDDRPDDFAKPLARLLKTPRDDDGLAVAMALAVWATPSVERELIEALGRAGDMGPTDYLMKALARVGTENAAIAIAQRAKDDSDTACSLLAAMGPVAEKPALELLRSENASVVASACKVLAQVGGEPSARALNQLLFKSNDDRVRREGKTALAAVRRRIASGAAKSPTPSAAAATPETSPMRTWTDASGKFQIQARMLECREGKVTLEKEDGSTVTVPLDKLSDADRQFVNSASP